MEVKKAVFGEAQSFGELADFTDSGMAVVELELGNGMGGAVVEAAMGVAEAELELGLGLGMVVTMVVAMVMAI